MKKVMLISLFGLLFMSGLNASPAFSEVLTDQIDSHDEIQMDVAINDEVILVVDKYSPVGVIPSGVSITKAKSTFREVEVAYNADVEDQFLPERDIPPNCM